MKPTYDIGKSDHERKINAMVMHIAPQNQIMYTKKLTRHCLDSFNYFSSSLPPEASGWMMNK